MGEVEGVEDLQGAALQTVGLSVEDLRDCQYRSNL